MLKVLGLRGGRDFVRHSVLQYDFDDGRTSDTTSEIIGSSIGECADDTQVAICASWIDSVTVRVSTSKNTITQTKCNRRQLMLGNCKL